MGLTMGRGTTCGVLTIGGVGVEPWSFDAVMTNAHVAYEELKSDYLNSPSRTELTESFNDFSSFAQYKRDEG
eukprot:gene41188-50985_t